jgi:putative transcriptional regulator
MNNDSLFNNDAMIFNRIAVLRAERSLSRQVLAREIGVHPQTVGFLERGDYIPSLELVFKLTRFFNLPVEAVFSPEPFRPLSEQVYPLPESAPKLRTRG